MAARKPAGQRPKRRKTPTDDIALEVVDGAGQVVQTVIVPAGAKTQEIPLASVLPSVLSEENVGRLTVSINAQTAELMKFRKVLRIEQRAFARRRRKELWLKVVGGAKDVLDVAADKVVVGARFLGRKARGLVISEGKRKPATA